jgi:hypothetical protein
MRLLIPLLLLISFLTLVSAKDWCWRGKCPGHPDDTVNPSKRFSVRRQDDGPVFNDNPDVVHNDNDDDDDPVFIDNPDVVHNDGGKMKRSSYTFFAHARVNLPPSWSKQRRAEMFFADEDEGPMFNDMSNVVLNDDAVADGRKCHADCALIHELCMEKGNMNGGKCAGMQCGVFGDKVCL